MVSTIFKVTLAATALLASACAKTETIPAAEKPAETDVVKAQAIENKPAARGGNIVALPEAVSYTHLRAHETKANLVCRLLLEKKK